MAVLRITKERLKEQLEKGESVVLLDVRSHDSYNKSNIKIKGSLRKDPMAVKSWEKELPRDRPIITYCT
jgi:rhodanese-related sulfurtransferase